ncbi:MAG: GPP34 family phosphoprotein [Promethearchaeota archaeon]
MLIVDQLFLIGIDEKSKKFILKWDDYLLYGALIIDLILKDKISISKKDLKIEIINYESTNELILDKMLDFIKNNQEDKTLIELCIKFMKGSNKSEFIEYLETRFGNSELIKYLGKKMLKRRYQLIKPAVREGILEEIIDVLFENSESTKELTFLLSLLNIESNYLKIIGKKSKRIAETRIRKIIKNEYIGNAIQDYIEELKEQSEEFIDDVLYND